jgi:hypothetical protein
MFGRRQAVTPWSITAVMAGTAAGAAGAMAFAVLRGVRSLRRRQTLTLNELDALEDEAVDALRRDSVTGVCAIDVAAIGPNTIELTGLVPSRAAAQRAARLLHALHDVHTVISRLEIGSFEARLADNRERLARGEPSTQQRRWYGVRVGTGRRRQSLETDPPRPDDTVERLARDLEVDELEVQDATSAEPGHTPFDAAKHPL